MANIQHLLDKIRTAIYGKEVRGSLADGLEAINKETEDATEVAVNVEQRQDAVEQQFDDVLNEWTDDKPISNEETIAARTNRETGENHQTLGQRLDAENKKVTAQLAETSQQLINLNNNKMDKAVGATKQELQQKETEIISYLDNQLTQIGNMTPRGAYATLQALKNAYPDGSEGIFVVQDSGHWYYWNGNVWTDGGVYQATPWADFMTEQNEDWVI